ncbi:ESPR domain-containing protein, partial [Dialister succinatiphilus]
MNKIYKVIWSKAKHTYVVASEIAKGHTKGETTGRGLKKLAAALLVAAALLSPSFAWAADTVKVEPATDTASTTAVEVYTKEWAEKEISTLSTQIGTNATNNDTNTTNINGLTTRVNALESSKTDTALHISSSGDLIVGTKENQTVKDMEIRGKLTSGSISTGGITSTGDVTVAGKMAADGVTDETTKDGTYIKQNNTVGNNLVSLDTQVKANADAIAEKVNAADVYTKDETDQKVDAANTYTYRKVATEEKAREAADKALDDRITNVKEYLEKQTSDNYVSKADAAVQDGAIVKAANTIGENVTNLDAALAKETAARLGADAAQDKVIKQVNDNLVASVNTINKNVADGFTALNQADANEAAAREAKDNELNERITNEANGIHDEIKAGDKALDDRITNVKEYLEKQTSDTYVSKDDAAVQNGAIVKADKTIGENVTNLDAALAKETAARLGADKAQDKVIETVNQNMVDGFNT